MRAASWRATARAVRRTARALPPTRPRCACARQQARKGAPKRTAAGRGTAPSGCPFGGCAPVARSARCGRIAPSPQNHAFVHSRPRSARCVRHKSGGFVQPFGRAPRSRCCFSASGVARHFTRCARCRARKAAPFPRGTRSRARAASRSGLLARHGSGSAHSAPRWFSRAPRSPILSQDGRSRQGNLGANRAEGRTAPP